MPASTTTRGAGPRRGRGEVEDEARDRAIGKARRLEEPALRRVRAEEVAAARAAGAQPVCIVPGDNGAGDLPAFGTLQQFSDALLTGHLALR